MATLMYKGKNSMMVRGKDVQARLDAGWTFEPAKTKITLRPKRTKRTNWQSEVEQQQDLTGPEDLTTIEEQ
jgi:hypothetical protein